MTDANLMLGRLVPDYFPKIFGKSANEPLDIEASRKGFEVLLQQINTEYEKDLGLDEIVYGCATYSLSTLEPGNSSSGLLSRFIKVANETMCRPIRALTEARGYALQKHM